MTSPASPSIAIRNGRTLLPDGSIRPADVRCAGPLIAAVGDAGAADLDVDATDALVLPGLVDIHGDGFERTVMPRPGVFLDTASAVAETRAQLLNAGITTAFISVTDGWEPGLRSRARLRELIDELARPGAPFAPKLALHVRHERCNTDGFEELVAWVTDGSIAMLSYNDHTPGGIVTVDGISELQVKRSGMTRRELERCRVDATGRRELGFSHERRLAEAANSAGTPTASHDGSTDEDLRRDIELGVDIAEFPMSIELAHRYRAEGIAVLLGAPNLVRGHSHLGNLSVRDAWSSGAVDLICSDYHYQSLLHAPFALTDLGAALHEAWHTVSRGPAEAAGIHSVGVIEPGAGADLVVVEPPVEDRPARVRTVVVDGRLASLTP